MGVGIASLPRELAPGVFWIGDCSMTAGIGDASTHTYNSPYVVAGEEHSLIVDTGIPKDWRAIERHLDELLDGGLPPVSYCFPTHPELMHAANLGRLLVKFPDAMVYARLRDCYHLIYPEFAGRIVGVESGDEIDLGERTLDVLDAIFEDLPSQWLYDRSAGVLFTGDGFSYAHLHVAGECGKCAEEIVGMPVPELTAIFSEAAFYWTRFCDIEPIIAQLEDLVATLGVNVVAPAHGCPILDLPATMPLVIEGLRLGRQPA